MSKQQTVLVTGGAGFIGSNFIRHFLNARHGAVVNLDALTYAGNPGNLADFEDDPRYTFVHGDIANSELVQDILNERRPSCILNFAAESHVDRSIHGPADFIKTNVIGTFNLLECARKYWGGLTGSDREAFRFLHVSTDEVYGTLQPEDSPFSEQNNFRPNSPYSASKAGSDHLVRAWHKTYQLPVVTTNCSNNYGPYQFPEKLIPLVIHNALNLEPIPIYGDGQQVRDWLYVEDHCRAIVDVLERGNCGETYNVGGLNEKANLDVVRTLCEALDELRPRADGLPYFDLIEYVDDRPGHDRRYAIDASKLSSELGWAPVESFETGMHKTVEWYLENADWVESVTSGAYQNWIKQQYAG